MFLKKLKLYQNLFLNTSDDRLYSLVDGEFQNLKYGKLILTENPDEEINYSKNNNMFRTQQGTESKAQ